MGQEGTMRDKLQLTRHNIYSYILSILFFGMLLAPILKPGWAIATIKDSFKWRKDLVQLFNSYRIKIGDRVFSTTLVGNNGWLFYTGEGAIDDYQGVGLAKQKDLRQLQQSLDKIKIDLMQQGISLVIVIPPNKESIYPQFMPDEIYVLRNKSPLDQFVEYMHLHSNTRIIDLRPVLKNASKSWQVYFKTDTHWNQYGAYFAYQNIFLVLSEDYPALQAHPLSDYEITLGEKTTRDIANIIGLPQIKEADWIFSPKFPVNKKTVTIPLNGLNRQVRIVSNENQTFPSIVVFHDSFFTALSPFFEAHFSRLVSVPVVSKDFNSRSVWTLTWVEQQKPDIVIIELVERYLWELPELLSTY